MTPKNMLVHCPDIPSSRSLWLARRRAVCIGLLLVAIALPASAVDLTGTWQATRSFACSDTTVDGVERQTLEFTDLQISQSAMTLTVAGGLLGSPRELRGWVIEDQKGVGRGVLQQCDGASGSAHFRLVAAKTFLIDGDGISGHLLLTYVQATGDLLQSCEKVEFVRTSTIDPNPEACP